jgi:hypothetical protein
VPLEVDSTPFKRVESPPRERIPPPQLPSSSATPVSAEKLAIRPLTILALDRLRFSETLALDRARSTTPGGTKGPRVKWSPVPETTLLEALEAIVKRGKTSDGFKKDY